MNRTPDEDERRLVDRSFLTQCESSIQDAAAKLSAAASAAGACEAPFDSIILFSRFGDEVCELIRERRGGGSERILAVGAPGVGSLSDRSAWPLLEAGASDVLMWDELAQPAEAIADRLGRWKMVDEVLHSPLVVNHLVGAGRAWKAVLRQVVEATLFSDACILLLGPTGTGKERLAQLIHALAPTAQHPVESLIVVDCTTVVPELAGSEFFGHERGAFTGAVAQREGAFALADGGTLFLDEIGELPARLQAQLLRAVQEGTYKRIGGNTWHNAAFRLVCATHRDLLEDVKEGRFRSDLYYRIAGWVCRVPSLAERREDILPLARHFLKEGMMGSAAAPAMTPAVESYLMTRDYPGNVRDLRQTVLRMVRRHVGHGPITIGDIAEDDRGRVLVGSSLPDPGTPCEASAAASAAGAPGGIWPDDRLESSIRRALDLGVGLREIGRAAEELAFRIATESAASAREAAGRLGISERALHLRRATRRNGRGRAGETKETRSGRANGHTDDAEPPLVHGRE